MSVVHSQLLYGVPVWIQALKSAWYQNIIQSPQQIGALRVTSVYCTVSLDALMVVTSIPPIFLLAQERCEIIISKGADEMT